MRTRLAIVAICLLSGCAVFSRPAFDTTSHNSPSEGEWCLVRMSEMKEGLVTTHIEHVGILEKSDREVIILSDAGTRIWTDQPFRKVPYVNRLWKHREEVSEPTQRMTIPRDGIHDIISISAEEADRRKRPIQRIGIDFDFNENGAMILRNSPEL